MNSLSKFHVKYLLYYQDYANTESIILTGPCSPFLKIPQHDKIYAYIERILEEKIESNQQTQSSTIEIEKYLSSENLNFNIFDYKIESNNQYLNSYTLNEIISRFLVEVSEYLSKEIYTLVVIILINLRNSFDIVGWNEYIEDFSNSNFLSSYLNETSFQNKDEKIHDENSKLDHLSFSLSEFSFTYLKLDKIMNYYISCYIKEEAPFIDYVFCVIVLYHFMDWCVIKKYMNKKIILNFKLPPLNNKETQLKEQDD